MPGAKLQHTQSRMQDSEKGCSPEIKISGRAGRRASRAKQAAEKVYFAVIPNPDKHRDRLREESLFDLNPGKEGFLGKKRASE